MTLRRKIAVLFMLCCATLRVQAQSTSVTLQATDTDTQSWNLGTWTAVLYSPPGVPNTNYVIAGGSTPVPNQTQSGTLNSSGGASLTVTPNTSIVPTGTQWQFTFCSAASPSPCQSVNVAVTGSSQTVAPTLAAIRVSIQNPSVRVLAYRDAEITGFGLGVFYFNITDSSIHICTIFSGGVCTWTVNFGSSVPATAQIGDSLRFNIAGDGGWDPTNLMTAYQSMFMNNFGATLTALGPYGTSGTNASGFSTGVNATTSLQGGATFASSAVGSLNTVISARAPEGGSSGLMGMLAIYRFSIRLALISTTNSRFWAGVAAYSNGSGNGTNGQQPEGTASFANDTPNRTMIAFRYSSGVLSNHWAAVTAVGGGSQTTVDTGVTGDTNPHLFEWTSNSNGTQYTFYIDGAQVAQSSTNLPTVGTADSGTGLLFWTGDNKNTANSVSASFWSAIAALKY